MVNIKYTNWGIAYAFRENNQDVIELNSELSKYPELKKRILKHEKEHLKNPDFHSNLWIEFKDMFDFKTHNLMARHLSLKIRMQSLIPIWYYKGQINTNSALLFIYLMFILGIIVIF